MLKLVIGNRRYSSWSLRGWLAASQSGLPFETHYIPMDTPDWVSGRAKGLLPAGRVPVLWDGDHAVWDSLAIVEWLAERAGRERFWPVDDAARAMARSIAAEMHSGFAALRQACSMDLKRRYPGFALPADAAADTARIEAIFTEARTRFGTGGDYLFGAFGAADIMFAPVTTRFTTYEVALSPVSQAYVEAVAAHPFMAEWRDAALAETEVLEKYHLPGGVDL